jgi:hypothetical protein
LSRHIYETIVNEELPVFALGQEPTPWYGKPLLYSSESVSGVKDAGSIVDIRVYRTSDPSIVSLLFPY